MALSKKKFSSAAFDRLVEGISSNLPSLALVGRTNVGKSTLFNCLTQSQSALTANTPNLTRDRRVGIGYWDSKHYKVIDTGGLEEDSNELASLIKKQAHQALQEATYIGMVVDAQSGLTAQDYTIVHYLRKFNKPIVLIVNKVEGRLSSSLIKAEFSELGLQPLYLISAIQKQGVSELINFITQASASSSETLSNPIESIIRIAIIGRPNVGKSTLINQLLGENRHIVSDELGTTRDSIAVPFKVDDQNYLLIDTAGIRRSAKIEKGIETNSVNQSLQSIYSSHVTLFLMDATAGITDQDLRLLQLLSETGRALVVLFNKWDCLDLDQKKVIQADIKRRLHFIAFAQIGFISALSGLGLRKIFHWVQEAYSNATQKFSTPRLTRLLQQALQAHSPPAVSKHIIKLRYAHPGGSNPPIIVIHGTHTKDIPPSYHRYLENFYRRHLRTTGTPLKITFKDKR